MNVLADNPPPWAYAKHFRRNQGSVLVPTSNIQLLPANPNRIGLIISSPNSDAAGQIVGMQVARAVDTSTTGVKTQSLVSGGQSAILYAATQIETAGTGVVSNLQLFISGNATNIAQFTTNGQFIGPYLVDQNTTVQINVVTPIGASFCDFSLSLAKFNTSNRVTLSFSGPAILDQGITLPPNGNPLVLWRDVIGDCITEDVFAIAPTTNVRIGFLDIFY